MTFYQEKHVIQKFKYSILSHGSVLGIFEFEMLESFLKNIYITLYNFNQLISLLEHRPFQNIFLFRTSFFLEYRFFQNVVLFRTCLRYSVLFITFIQNILLFRTCIQNIVLCRTCIQCITGVRIIEQRRNNQTEGYDQYDTFQFKGNYFTTLHLVTAIILNMTFLDTGSTNMVEEPISFSIQFFGIILLVQLV